MHIPLRDFFRNPDKVYFKISPNGKYLSYLAPFNSRLNIFIKDVGKENNGRITNETERDIYNYFWKGSSRLLYLQDNGGDENFKLYSVDINTKETVCLTPFDNVKTEIVDELKDFEDIIYIGMNKRDPAVFDVYKLNVNSGEMEMAVQNPGNITYWKVDHDGKIRAAEATDGVNTELLYRENENEDFRTVLKTGFREGVKPLFFTFDNEQIYASSNLNRDCYAIVKFDIANGVESEIIYENPLVDVFNLSYSRKRKVLTVVSFHSWKNERHILDPEIEKIYSRIAALLGDRYDFRITDHDDDESRYLIAAYNDRTRGIYYTYDSQSDVMEKLCDSSPWLKEDELAEVKPVTYQARDELTIHGYLTLPVGAEPKNLPFVINPHGGPWHRDYWGYNPEIQFLANRGYGVFQMNFRGSIGYGRKFWEASFKEWGKKMQDDITDGVKWLIEQGIADPGRIAIYGGSYGGYAVLAGLTFTPDLYRCGVDYVGVSNLFTFMQTIPPYWKPFLEMMYEMVGHPEKDKDLLTGSSPAFHVDKIKAPLLIAQGANDPRVKKSESDQMVEALKKRGVDVPYIVKENEGHGFHNEENRFEFYEAMEKFLEKHLNHS